jgi:hypothetical protein
MASKKTTARRGGNTAGEPEQPNKTVPQSDKLVPNKGISAEQLAKIVEQDEGVGQENMSAKDMAIPRISVLQSGSPQVKKSEGKYVKGAEEGDFFDNVTNSVYAKGEDGFLFVPVAYRRANIEWVPKDDGGGFVADHGADDSILTKCTKDKKNRMMLPNGHEIVTTAEYFIIAINKETWATRNAVISLAKTQLSAARKLNTMINELLVPRQDGTGKFNPAMFYSVFDATTVPQSKDDFNWMGWNIVRKGDTMVELPDGPNIYLAARQFRLAVVEGQVKVQDPVAGESHGAGGAPDDGKSL